MFHIRIFILASSILLIFLSTSPSEVDGFSVDKFNPERQRRCSPAELCVGLDIDINLNLCASDGFVYILFKNECQRRVKSCKTGIDYIVVDISLCLGLPALPDLL